MPELHLIPRWAVVKTLDQWLLCDLEHERFVWFALEPENALALASLDGHLSLAAIASTIAHTFQRPEAMAERIVVETIERFRHA